MPRLLQSSAAADTCDAGDIEHEPLFVHPQRGMDELDEENSLGEATAPSSPEKESLSFESIKALHGLEQPLTLRQALSRSLTAPTEPPADRSTLKASIPPPQANIARLPMSALRRQPSSRTSFLSGKPAAPRTGRRVRGLWSNEASRCGSHDLFAQLQNDTVLAIFSNLTLLEATASSRVCTRWRCLLASGGHPDRACLLPHVDATDLVHRAFGKSGSASTTSAVLDRLLSERRPERLTIQNIHHRLECAGFVPCIHHQLVELTITHYDDLSDASVHAMLLSPSLLARAGDRSTPHHSNLIIKVHKDSGNALRKLRLEHCPRLSNSSVRSIAVTCPRLEALSLRGCPSIDSLDELCDLWKRCFAVAAMATAVTLSSIARSEAINVKPSASAGLLLALSSAAAKSKTDRGLASMFDAPPASPTSVMAAVASVDGAKPPAPSCNVPPSLPSQSSMLLSSLFVPPPALAKSTAAKPKLGGSAPVTDSRRTSALSTEGSLTNLDVAGTGITAASLFSSLSYKRFVSSARGGQDAHVEKIVLERLVVPGPEQAEEDEADSDSDPCLERRPLPPQWRDLPERVDVARLREFRCGNRRLAVGCGGAATCGREECVEPVAS
jgi:hypothetical protein